MSTFDDRESAFENKFAHDAELEFMAEAQRNKKIAYWAAELLGKSSEEAAGYAKEIIRTDFLEPGAEPVIRKLIEDLGSKADEAAIRAKMDQYLNEARASIQGET